MPWLGLDIGGANVKLADGNGYAESQAFPLWQRPGDLAAELRRLIDRAPECDQIAVTMTGELADCFSTKSDGVRQILDAVERAVGDRTTRIYLVGGKFESVGQARECVELVAAANWHAVARFSGRFAPTGPALLIDIGSTTCDLIPLHNGVPLAAGVDDTARLLQGELVYSGVARTPVCGLVSHLPWRGTPCPVAREWFATSRDVYLLTGESAEDSTANDTADGQPATIEAARIRMARMICADPIDVTREDARAMAESVASRQASQIAAAIDQVVARMGEPPATIILSGEGEFLGRQAVQAAELAGTLVSLSDRLGRTISGCAPAHAVAVLAAEDAAP